MSSLDELQIKIISDSSAAEKAIDSLVKKLQTLNKQLGFSDGTKFTKAVDSVTRSVSKLNTASTSKVTKELDNVATSAGKAQQAVEQMQKVLNGASNNSKNLFGYANGFTSDVKGVNEKGYLDSAGNVIDGKMLPALNHVQEYIQKVTEGSRTFSLALSEARVEADRLPPALRQTAEVFNDPWAKDKIIDVDATITDAETLSSKLKDIFSNLMQNIKDYVGGGVTDAVGDAIADFQKYDEEFQKSQQPAVNFSEKLLAVSSALSDISEKCEKVAGKLEKVFFVAIKPLMALLDEFKEKFEGVQASIQDFVKGVKSKLTKLSAFWKRIMRTFTFMVVRKAITAIIKSINEGIGSLAKFSNAMGTQFNTSLSNIVADFKWLAYSIVGAFEPLINAIAPIIDAIIAKVVALVNAIGMLIATLTGSSSYTKAVRNVDNYAESLDNANKKSKQLTMGIDELNVLSEKSGSSGSGGNPLEEWEEVEIPIEIVKMGEKIKDIFEDLFRPLKAAWDDAKKYVTAGLKYMLSEFGKLFKDIGRDFLEMWNEEKTVKMLSNMLKIVGDLAITAGNLAMNFRDAWNYNKTGLHILEDMRDILYTIVRHVRNVTLYMTKWSTGVNFRPLLTSLDSLLKKVNKLADFLGGVFEDVMENVVLKYIEFLIEEGFPHLMKTIGEVIDSFDFEKIRQGLVPLEEAFETLLENLDIGKTEAIGNIGKAIGEFTSSDEFMEFLETIAEVMNKINAEDVEKILTGIGLGILNIAKAVVNFVNSDTFMNFIDWLDEWVAGKTADDIAGIIENIAKAILLFKFTSFTTSKLSGFFKFIAAIWAFKNAHSLLSNLKNIGSTLDTMAGKEEKVSLLSKALSGLKTKFSELLPSLSSGSFSLKALGSDLTSMHTKLSPVTKAVGSLAVGFLEFETVSSTFKDMTLGIDSIGSSIAQLVVELGLAGVAFTALLGFPAGIIATGCVAAVAALSGINDAIKEIQMEGIYDAILTEGDVTIRQVEEWYDEATSTISDSVSKWQEETAKLREDSEDINSYSESIAVMTAVFANEAGKTQEVADVLIAQYEELEKAINDYIDDSTYSLIANILAQQDYLEAQGYDVDSMITDVLSRSQSMKDALGENFDALVEAYNKMSQFEEGTDEWNAAAEEFAEQLAIFRSETEQFSDTMEQIDTSAAVSELEELGDTLGTIDLSEFGTGEAGYETAVQELSQGIEDIKSTYETKVNELKETIQQKKDEVQAAYDANQIDENTYNALMAGYEEQLQQGIEAYSTAAETALDAYDATFRAKLEEVAEQAAADWDELDPLEKIATGDRNKYIMDAMQKYVDDVLGEEGLIKDLNEAYAAIPGGVEESSSQAMKEMVDDMEFSWSDAIDLSLDDSINANEERWREVIESVENIDTDTAAQGLADKSALSWMSAIAADLAEMRSSAVETYQEAVDGVSEVDTDTPAQGAAAKLNTSWLTAISDSVSTTVSNISSTLQSAIDTATANLSNENTTASGKTTGESYVAGVNEGLEEGTTTAYDYGAATVEGYNSGISDNQESTTTTVDTWMTATDTAIHDSAMAFGSPSQTAYDYGVDTVTGYNDGLDASTTSTKTYIEEWFRDISGTLKEQKDGIKDDFNALFTDVFEDIEIDYAPLLDSLFTGLSDAISENAEGIGTTIGDTLDTIWNDSVVPWFDDSKWTNDLFTPLGDTIESEAEDFMSWWDTTIADWWDNHTMTYFTETKWDTDIFTPLGNLIQEHFANFLSWWDTSMTDWWDNHVVPFFAKDKWLKEFNHVYDAANEAFEKVRKIISDKIKSAKNDVVTSCTEMVNSLKNVANAINGITSMGGFSIKFEANGYATGGFPAEGSLFFANEAGPELVGTIGGRTAVASNDEITGIRDAVYASGNEQASLLSRLITIATEMLEKEPVVIGDREIARMATRGQSQLGMSIIT